MSDSNRERKEILFDGFSVDEILALPAEQIEALVLNGQPMVFRAGSAAVLGEFRRDKDRLVVELAQIEGGGEGVLVSLGSLVERYARLQRIETVEWIVHAVTCAKPNLKLQRVLDRRGFRVRDLPGIGPAYYYLDSHGDGWLPAKSRGGPVSYDLAQARRHESDIKVKLYQPRPAA